MKIAFVSYEYPPDTAYGGVATYVSQAAQMLARRGHHVEVFAASPSKSGRHFRNGVTVHLVRTSTHEGFSEKIAPVFAERHCQVRFDVLEGPEWAADARHSVRLAPEIPLVVKLHTPTFLSDIINDPNVSVGQQDDPMEQSKVRGATRYDPERDPECAHAQSADEVVSPSRSLGQIVAAQWDLDARRLVTIPYPYKPAAGLLKIPIRTETNRVTFIGRLEVRKGVLEFAKAIPEILKKYPKTRFRFVGRSQRSPVEGVGMAEYLRQQLAPHLQSVEFLGPVPMEQIPSILASTDIVALPSRWENFPNACLEAMAAGRGVVGCRAGGMLEMLDEGDCGMLVRPNSPGDLVASLCELLGQPEQRMALGEKARRRILTEYSDDNIGLLMERGYERAIERRRLAGPRLRDLDEYERGLWPTDDLWVQAVHRPADIGKPHAVREVAPPVMPAPETYRPQIEIVIPAYNATRYLEETVNSVRSQTFTQWRLTIINDGSTDGTPALAETLAQADFRIRVIHQKNAGLPATRNRGIHESDPTVPYITFLDADDLWHPYSLKLLLNALKADPEAVAAHGNVRFVNSFGRHIRWNTVEREIFNNRSLITKTGLKRAPLTAATELRHLILQNNIVTSGAALIRRSALEKAGEYDLMKDLERASCEDWDLWIRLSLQGHLAVVPEIVLDYRRHEGNLSSRERLMRQGDMYVYRKTALNPALSPELAKVAQGRLCRQGAERTLHLALDYHRLWKSVAAEGRPQEAAEYFNTYLRLLSQYPLIKHSFQYACRFDLWLLKWPEWIEPVQIEHLYRDARKDRPRVDYTQSPINSSCRRCRVPFDLARKRVLVEGGGTIEENLKSLALVSALRNSLPEIYIVWMVTRDNRDLVNAHPIVDEVLHWDPNYFLRLLNRGFFVVWLWRMVDFRRQVRARKFDAFITFNPNSWKSLRHWAKRYVPLAYTLSDGQEKWHSPVHVDEVCRALDVLPPKRLQHQVGVGYTADDAEYVAYFLYEINVDTSVPFVVVIPSLQSEREEAFARTARLCRLLERSGVRCFLLGDAEDRETLDALAASLTVRPTVIAGQFTIRQQAALIAKCSLLLARSPEWRMVADGLKIKCYSPDEEDVETRVSQFLKVRTAAPKPVAFGTTSAHDKTKSVAAPV